MAWVARNQNHYASLVMADYCVIRRSIVVGDAILPRPKIVQNLLLIGPKDYCEKVAISLRDLPENQSSDTIEVEVCVSKYARQKTCTSARPENGNRKARK